MKNILKPCSCPGCLAVGKWKPVILVQTPDNDKTFTFDFQHTHVCDEHKKQMTLEHIIGGPVFNQLIDMFKAKFIHPPKKRDCSLKWENVSIPIFSAGNLIGHTNLIR